MYAFSCVFVCLQLGLIEAQDPLMNLPMELAGLQERNREEATRELGSELQGPFSPSLSLTAFPLPPLINTGS